MATRFQLKRSSVGGVVPTTGDIAVAELAVNVTDRKLYTSDGTAVFQLGSGSVTQVSTGNGLTGGPITTTGTVSVLANSGIIANSSGTFVFANTGLVANATGVHINSTYIGTLSANNSSYLGGNLPAYYTNASNITTGTLPWAQVPAGTVNTSGSFTFSNNITYNANLTIAATGELIITAGAGIYANGLLGTAGQVLTSNGTTVYWSTVSAGSGTPGGVNTQVQFNNSGAFGGNANLTFDNITGILSIGSTKLSNSGITFSDNTTLNSIGQIVALVNNLAMP